MMLNELYIQLGPKDTPAKTALNKEARSRLLNFIGPFGELDHGIGEVLDQLNKINVTPSERAVDLLVIAAAVHIADTSTSRSKFSTDGWTRQIGIHVPVSDKKVWAQTSEHLQRMLKFLTGDYWTFHFRDRPQSHKTLATPSDKLDLSNFDPVSLFSGGLDSLIGAIDLLGSGRKPLFISHYWDSEASSAQKALNQGLIKEYGEASFKVLRARIGVTKPHLVEAGSEGSQRARSFLFYSMAAIAADALKTTDSVLIPENGLIALNVPMDPLRLGSLSTRTAHPFFISSMQKLCADVGMSTKFENPYRFKTKGEMVAGCSNKKLLKALAPSSMSCSSPAKVRWLGDTPQHCGYCVPCLIRRASLKAGLKTKDQTEYYLDDLWDRSLDSKDAEGRDIRSFIYAARTLKKKNTKAEYLVRKPGPLPSAEIADYASVYSRGMAEVAKFLGKVDVKHG